MNTTGAFCAQRPPFPRPRTRPIFEAMAKSPPKKPKKKKDPAKPTRAKAARPDEPATPDALAELLNPAIKSGTAGLGSGTGAQHARVTSPLWGEVDRAKRGRVRGSKPVEAPPPPPDGARAHPNGV